MDGPDAARATCARCGRVSDPRADGDPPLTWTRDTAGDTAAWLCPGCTRRHLRDIEGRLDQDWW